MLSRVQDEHKQLTHKKHSGRDLHLTFGTEDGDDVRRHFLVWESNFGVCLGLDVMNENTLLAEEGAVVLAGNRDGLINVILILEKSRKYHNNTNARGTCLGINQLHHRLL